MTWGHVGRHAIWQTSFKFIFSLTKSGLPGTEHFKGPVTHCHESPRQRDLMPSLCDSRSCGAGHTGAAWRHALSQPYAFTCTSLSLKHPPLCPFPSPPGLLHLPGSAHAHSRCTPSAALQLGRGGGFTALSRSYANAGLISQLSSPASI